MEILHRAFLESIEAAIAELTEDQIDAFLQRDEGMIGRIVREEIEFVTPTIFQKLVENAPAMLHERRAELASFEEALLVKWGRALDLFEALLVIALEAGAAINEIYRPTAVANSELRFLVLTTLHARACQIAGEVLTLLKAGYADGAHARWRSLHEVAVVEFVLAEGDAELAERYSLHQHVEEYKAMQEYQKYCARLNCKPYSDDELRDAQELCDELVKRFGEPFKKQYGWAASLFANNHQKFDPKFDQHLEKKSGLDHFRPYYRLASHNVHAGPKGSSFRLGKKASQDLLLAGPSSFGVGVPIHGAAISLYQATVALLASWPNIDRLVILKVMGLFVNRIGEAVLAVEPRTE